MLESEHMDVHRTPSINAQCRSMPIKILALIPMSINSDQCHDFDRHWSLIGGVLMCRVNLFSDGEIYSGVELTS